MNQSHREFYVLLAVTVSSYYVGWRTRKWYENKKLTEGPRGIIERHPKERIPWKQNILHSRPQQLLLPTNQSTSVVLRLWFFGCKWIL